MTSTLTCDWRINLQDIGLGTKERSCFFQNPHRLILSDTAFAVEVVLEESYVRLGWILPGEKLGICRDAHSWCLHLQRLPQQAVNVMNG